MTKLLHFIVVPILVCIFLSLSASPVLALQAGHSGSLNPEVKNGSTYSQILEIGLSENEAETDIYIQVLGYKEIDDKPEPIEGENDNSKFSARSFIEPTDIIIHCKPGEKQRTQINVHIPEDANSGGRYAALRFGTAPLGKNSAPGLSSAIILPMKFTVIGVGPLVHTGKIVAINIAEANSGKPIHINTSFTNTGNHHFNIRGTIEIRDTSNKLIDSVFINSSSPIPESTKRILTTYIPKEELPLGDYFIKERLTLEDGALLDEGEGQFEIKAPYVPPPAPASIELKPSSASTLKTVDGRISVDFPQGAVLGETQVYLLSYPPEQLPKTPSGYSIAATCFRVDGLTGLLVKPATLKVKYSSADLEKAGGDPSRLRLARWDEAVPQWTLLETRLDSDTQTLSTETNQFSLWTVMVGPLQSTVQINWTIISGAIALAILVIVLAALSRSKSKK